MSNYFINLHHENLKRQGLEESEKKDSPPVAKKAVAPKPSVEVHKKPVPSKSKKIDVLKKLPGVTTASEVRSYTKEMQTGRKKK